MGGTPSKYTKDIENQEKWVSSRCEQKITGLKNQYPKETYSMTQVKGKLREEYHATSGGRYSANLSYGYNTNKNNWVLQKHWDS